MISPPHVTGNDADLMSNGMCSILCSERVVYMIKIISLRISIAVSWKDFTLAPSITILQYLLLLFILIFHGGTLLCREIHTHCIRSLMKFIKCFKNSIQFFPYNFLIQ